jgi:hypothetical protein
LLGTAVSEAACGIQVNDEEPEGVDVFSSLGMFVLSCELRLAKSPEKRFSISRFFDSFDEKEILR